MSGDCVKAAEDGEAGGTGAVGEGFAGMDDVGGEGGGDLFGRAVGETGGGAGGKGNEGGGGAALEGERVDCLVFGVLVIRGEEVGGLAGDNFGEEALTETGREAINVSGRLGEMPSLGCQVIEGLGTGGGEEGSQIVCPEVGIEFDDVGGIELEAEVCHGAEHAGDTVEAIEVTGAVERGGALNDTGREAGGREWRGLLGYGHDGGIGVELKDTGGGEMEEGAVGGVGETNVKHFGFLIFDLDETKRQKAIFVVGAELACFAADGEGGEG